MHLKEKLRWFFQGSSPGAQRLRRIVKILILIALFAALFWMVPLKAVVQAMLSADPIYLLLGIVLGGVTIILTAVQMEPLTRNQGITHGVGKILAINLAVKFYLQFTPSTLVASGYRWYRLAQPGGKNVEALVALAFFRVLETFLTIAMGLAFFLLAGQQTSLKVSLFWLALILLLIIISWVLVTRYSLKIYRWFRVRSAGWVEKDSWQVLARRIEKFLIAVTAYADMPATDLLLSISAGIISALVGIASGVALAQAVGIDIGFMNMGWVQAVVLIATQLPFTVAGGLGVREVTLVAILSTFGVSADLALALSFLIFIRGIILSLLGGLVELIDVLRSKRSAENQPPPVDAKELR